MPANSPKPPRRKTPRDIEARVEFDSHRTCCKCRDESKKRIQIHHIDGDRSNYAYDNLAVLCFDCHDETEITGGQGRRLMPDVIALYNNTWRRIVRSRLLPPNEQVLAEYESEVLLDIALTIRNWSAQVTRIMERVPGKEGKLWEYSRDLLNWEGQRLDYLLAHAVHEYSEELFEKFKPVAEEHVLEKLRSISMTRWRGMVPQLDSV